MSGKLQVNNFRSTNSDFVEVVNTPRVDFSNSTTGFNIPNGEESTQGTPTDIALRFDTTNDQLKYYNENNVWVRIIDTKDALANTKSTVIRDGLTMYLDSANGASYPGTGTSWFDLAQGLEFTVRGTVPTPYELNDGVSSFSFNGDGYWQCDTGYEGVDLGGEMTLVFWSYNEGIGERDTIFEKIGPNYRSYEHEIAVTWETNNTYSWYSRYATYDYGRTFDPSGSTSIVQPMVYNKWNQIAIKMGTGKTTAPRVGKFSINGSNFVENYVTRSSNPILPAGPIRVGSGYAGPVESGAISVVLCYNRQLSDSEIKRTFDLFRGRHNV